MTLHWKRDPQSGSYVAEPFFIRKVEGWRPSQPRRNWIWEPHGPGFSGHLPAYETLADAKRACEATPYGLAQDFKAHLDAATLGHQTMYDHAHVTDDEARLLEFIKDAGEQIIVALEKLS